MFNEVQPYTTIPRDIAILICIFTGKFVLMANGQLKSIIDVREYERLNTLLCKRSLSDLRNLERSWKRKDRLKNKQRQKDYMMHFQTVDFQRHRGLFLQEVSVEEAMIPIKRNEIWCEDCETGLSSTDLVIEHRGFIEYFGEFMYYFVRYDPDRIHCLNCRKDLEVIRNKEIQRKKQKENRLPFDKKYNDKKCNDNKCNNKKSNNIMYNKCNKRSTRPLR
jgi:hypothetical protein